MPYIKLQNKSILPNNADCPAEVVAESVTCASSPFFKTSATDTEGRVVINGVSDQGYKLISPDSNTTLNVLKNDVFGNRLKINNVVQKYCFKGLAPINTVLLDRSEYGGGTTLYMYRRYDGYCELQNSSGTYIKTLSTANENKRIYTFVLCGGGAGGRAGTSGVGFHGGGGGGGGGGIIATIYFTEKCKTDMKNFKFKLYVGGGGGNNGNGGNTYVSMEEGPSNAGLTLTAGGGSTGSSSSGGSGGPTTIGFFPDDEYMYLVNYAWQNGQNGGDYKSASSALGVKESYNYSVNSDYIASMGGTSGAGYGDLATKPGGGGPSPFGNGNSGMYGGGGRGGTGNMFGGNAGISGARGFVEIRY